MKPVVAPTRDAVVAALNTAVLNTFTPSITAVPNYDIYFNLQELSGGRIIVTPSSREVELSTRGQGQISKFSLDIAVQFKYGTAGPVPAELDPYMNLSETIGQYFLGTSTDITLSDSTTAKAICRELTWPQIVYDKHLQEFSVYTSVIQPVFVVEQ